MIIDDIYINEAIRIRKTYLHNLLKIVETEEELKKYFNEIENIRINIEKYKNENMNIDEQKISSIMIEINKNIDNIRKRITPYSDNIKKLDDDQKKLYNNIKDKYPNINDEDIQTQILPHIIPVDIKFKEENEKIYGKIMNKQ